jgi:hypothetical protein
MNYIKSILGKPTIVQLIILILILSPLLFINLDNRHNWGDDFAQYLDQINYFIHKKNNPASEVLNYKVYSPINRGEGFSLLLSPITFFFGYQIYYYIVFLSGVLFLLGITLFYFFKPKIKSIYLVFILSLLFVYNYNTLDFKRDIITLFPFMLVLYLTFIHSRINSNTFLHHLKTAVLTGFLISFWNIGWVLFITNIIFLLRKLNKNHIQQIIVLSFVPLLVDLGIKKIVFGTFFSESILWYNDFFTYQNIISNFTSNLNFYLNILQFYFEQEIWGWFNTLIKNFVVVLFLIGLLKKWFTKIEKTDVFFILYMLTIICYPYQGAGIRFITPVIPLILLYIYQGINSISIQEKIKMEYVSILFFSVLLMSNYIKSNEIIAKKYTYRYGPQNKEAIEAFNYIAKNIDHNAIIASRKPWVLHLYTKHKSVCFRSENSFSDFCSTLNKFKTRYVLMSNNKLDRGVFNEEYFKEIQHTSNFKLIWSNRRFNLYEIINPL